VSDPTDKAIRDRMHAFATADSEQEIGQAAETYDAAITAVLDWAASMETDFEGKESTYGMAIAREVRGRIAAAMDVTEDA
jgi:hypothetical protein